MHQSTETIYQKQMNLHHFQKESTIQYVHTITTDNGSEFMNHKNICKALECTVYFADPYCSGQKGAIENANKILREYFPKGTDFKTCYSSTTQQSTISNQRKTKEEIRLFNSQN